VTPTPDRDVAVVGGGVAGPAAAVFLARAGLDTVVFDEGPSSLRECAHLGNYLGFPAGIDADRFLALAHAQVRECGATLHEEAVVAVDSLRADGGADPAAPPWVADTPPGDSPGPAFRLETASGRTVTAERVVAATKYDGSYLEPLADGALVTPADGDEPPTVDAALVGEAGRTPVAGVYVAGPLGGCVDQAMIAAGHGARTARAVVLDALADRGYWETAAEHYYDWRVRESAYEPGWDDAYADRLRATAPDDAGTERVERVVDAVIQTERDQAVDPETARERATAGQRALLEHVDDEVIRSYLGSTTEGDDAGD
jgi:cation diffusion facilitator CzcD-associated flavoprotein CzcO